MLAKKHAAWGVWFRSLVVEYSFNRAPSTLAGQPDQATAEKLVYMDISRHLKAWAGYSPLYRIGAIKVVTSGELSYENGTLTRTMKPRRPMIMAMFEAEANELLKKLE